MKFKKVNENYYIERDDSVSLLMLYYEGADRDVAVGSLHGTLVPPFWEIRLHRQWRFVAGDAEKIGEAFRAFVPWHFTMAERAYEMAMEQKARRDARRAEREDTLRRAVTLLGEGQK